MPFHYDAGSERRFDLRSRRSRAGRALPALAPGIKGRHARRSDVRGVTRDEGEAVVQRRRCELCIDSRQANSLAPGPRLQLAPTLRDRVVESEQPSGEAYPHIAVEPGL